MMISNLMTNVINEKPSKCSVNYESFSINEFQISDMFEENLNKVGYFSTKMRHIGVSFIFFVEDMYGIDKSYKIVPAKLGKDGWLSGGIFIHAHILTACQDIDEAVLRDIIEILLIEFAIKAGERKQYNVPKEAMDYLYTRRSKLGNIPDWIPEMDDNPQLVIDMYKASVPK